MKLSSRYTVTAVATVALFFSHSVFAGGLARIAFESGGETIVEIPTSDGDTEKLKAGGLVHLELGYAGNLISSDPAWETEGTIGYKFNSEEFSNGEMEFTRYTLNLMQYYRLSSVLRVGAGATYHLDGNFNFDFDIQNELFEGDVDFDNALGFMIAADYTVSNLLSLGARATQIEYEASDLPDAESLDGNSVGIYVSLTF